MPILALLRMLPLIGRMLVAITGWLARRKWGQWLMFYLVTGLGTWIEKLLTFAGLMLVSNEFVTPELLPFVTGPLLGMPDPFPQLLALTKIDQAITILISAVVTKAASSIRISRNPSAPNWSTSPGAA